MTPSFQREKAKDIFDEMMPLFEKHWREIAHYQDIKLNPDREAYFKIEEMGNLRVFTARDEEKNLIGYIVYFIRYNAHYKDSLQAVQDVLFVDPAKRGFGMSFIAWCDEQLRSEGVQVAYHHIKEKHNFGHMLEKMGYELVDLIYARRLD